MGLGFCNSAKKYFMCRTGGNVCRNASMSRLCKLSVWQAWWTWYEKYNIHWFGTISVSPHKVHPADRRHSPAHQLGGRVTSGRITNHCPLLVVKQTAEWWGWVRPIKWGKKTESERTGQRVYSPLVPPQRLGHVLPGFGSPGGPSHQGPSHRTPGKLCQKGGPKLVMLIWSCTNPSLLLYSWEH